MSEGEEAGHGHKGGTGGLVAALVPLGLAVVAYFGFKPTGLWTTAVGAVLALTFSAACALWAILLRRYVLVLKGAGLRKTARDRQPYAALRARLMTGGTPAIVYERWLTEALARVDRFFGDVGPDAASRTLWPHAFGLTTPAPLWTPASFDRCLLLALIYPIAVILLLWAVNGHQGPAEAALGLSGHARPWSRGISVVSIFIVLVCFRMFAFTTGWRSLLWLGLAFVAGAVAFAGAVAGAGAVVGAGAVAVAVGGAVAGAGAVAVAVAVGGAVAGAGAVAVAVGGAVLFLNNRAIARGRQGQFQCLFVPVFLALCLAMPMGLASQRTWAQSGPLLLFLGLLTLVNAPFDWFSLGLTRALLRRGLERNGWWPFVYGLFDAALAVAVIAALAIVMLLAVQTFDDLAVRGGGKATLDLTALLALIHDHPEQPETYWVYATLFSTMIPSLLNLCIGGTALLRGAPFATRWLLSKMPETGALPRADIEVTALVLTGQVFFGAALAILAQGLLFFSLIGYGLPWIGVDLLDICRDLATADLPGQALRAVAGPP